MGEGWKYEIFLDLLGMILKKVMLVHFLLSIHPSFLSFIFEKKMKCIVYLPG